MTVSGAFGKNPAITIPAQKASKALSVKTVIHGTGPVLGKTDAFVGNYAIYIWSGTAHRLAQVGVRWRDDGDSRLSLIAGNLKNLADIFRIRWAGAEPAAPPAAMSGARESTPKSK